MKDPLLEPSVEKRPTRIERSSPIYNEFAIILNRMPRKRGGGHAAGRKKYEMSFEWERRKKIALSCNCWSEYFYELGLSIGSSRLLHRQHGIDIPRIKHECPLEGWINWSV